MSDYEEQWRWQDIGGIDPPEKRDWVWKNLTKQEFLEAVDGLEDLEDCWVAIQAKLKEKNT